MKVLYLSCAALAACAHALGAPPPIESLAQASNANSAQLLQQAEAAWARREVASAERLYLQAARAEPSSPEAYAGAVRAKAWRIGHEAVDKGELATQAVQVGELCEQHVPKAALCDYWLANALGLQAREKPSTGHDALPHMVELLQRAIATAQTLDHGGPHRVLAILLLRAPGWPLGPGDAEAALPEAQAAMKVDPAHPPNLLALGEALQKNQQDGKRAYADALRLAEASSDPDAPDWARDAREALR